MRHNAGGSSAAGAAAIDEPIDLRPLHRQDLAVEIEADDFVRHVVEHALVVVERVAAANDQQIGVGLHARQPRPFGRSASLSPLPHNTVRTDARRSLDDLAAGQRDPALICRRTTYCAPVTRPIRRSVPRRRRQRPRPASTFCCGETVSSFAVGIDTRPVVAAMVSRSAVSSSIGPTTVWPSSVATSNDGVADGQQISPGRCRSWVCSSIRSSRRPVAGSTARWRRGNGRGSRGRSAASPLRVPSAASRPSRFPSRCSSSSTSPGPFPPASWLSCMRASRLAAAAAAAALLLLVFELLDQLVERLDDALLDLADLRTGAAQIEPAANVLHPPGDVVERVLLQALQVVLHQLRQRDVAARAGVRALQQHVDRLQARLLVQQGMVDDALVEQQRRGSDHVARRQARKLLQRLVEQRRLDQPSAEEQPEIVREQRRQLRVAKPRLAGNHQLASRLASTAPPASPRSDRPARRFAPAAPADRLPTAPRAASPRSPRPWREPPASGSSFWRRARPTPRP